VISALIRVKVTEHRLALAFKAPGVKCVMMSSTVVGGSHCNVDFTEMIRLRYFVAYVIIPA
jgi:hypothetical protein